ncbi:MAG: TonB-dependent receptor [Deltaproteobacteria bacterium]|nr:TonB-dependent receptor [Deltaproteobacteria bacterium]
MDDISSDDVIEFETTITERHPHGKDASMGTTVVDGDTLRSSTRSSTLEAISQQDAGVYVTGRGALHGVSNGATGGIYIRGLGGSPNSQVLVVEDGVLDYQGIFGHPIPDAYMPYLIDEVVVVKGGDSILYGTNAMGGVIIINNRWRKTDGAELQNDASYGSFNTLRESVAVLAKRRRLDFSCAFTGFSSDGHRTGAGGNEMVGHGALRYRFKPRWRLEMRYKVIHVQGADSGPASHPNPDHWYDVWRNNISAGLNWKRDDSRLTFVPFFNTGIHRLYDGFLSRDYVTGGTLEWQFRPVQMANVVLGISGQYVDGHVENRSDGVTENVRSQTDFSFYNQIAFRPFNWLTVTAGTREVYSLTYDFVFLSKMGIRLCLPKNLYFRTGVRRNFRQPTLRELYLPFPSANPDLKPEYATTADIETGYESEHFHASVTGYRTRADNMIKYFGSWPTAEVVNIDHITIAGVEGAIRVKKKESLFFNLSMDARDVGRYTKQNPSLKANATVGFDNRRLAADLAAEWVHGLYMSNYKTDGIDDVFFVDAQVRYRFKAAKNNHAFEPYLQVRNLLNRSVSYVEDYPLPGIHIMVGLKLSVSS